MKKLLGVLAIAAALFTVSSIARPNIARADGVALGVFCQAAAPGANLTQGECAKLVATLGPEVCKVPGNLGFPNQGQCVSTLQQLIRDLLRTY